MLLSDEIFSRKDNQHLVQNDEASCIMTCSVDSNENLAGFCFVSCFAMLAFKRQELLNNFLKQSSLDKGVAAPLTVWRLAVYSTRT